ncbi:multidrug transporter [Fructobacillus pseudoficulneus]|uniref:Multidrug transporter n=1 Tax=Fructobacillus pseudoficulneus TaxID=220714 RepID=A0A3F3GUH8_9LACO|nr:MFS transporter [Fructobacillus pseudoficulneus]GAP03015.1 multidrug transporter [Fructobacillus pseudoficulneus]SEH42049.1 drug resistance transporter, EmrB/QacA subfamily [Fructobacillus pseudoficulneus]
MFQYDFFRKKIILVAILIATFMTSVETTIITTALPSIVTSLNGLAFESWIFAVYLLTASLSTPIYGKLADRVGRKPVFVTGLVLFTFSSFLCGLSPNIFFLIAFRSLQGLGAGAIMPITFTMIADLFTYDERSKILGLNNTAWGISALTGPIIGGYLVEQLSWHWVFFVNIPLGLLSLVIILFYYDENAKQMVKTSLDWKGMWTLSCLLVSALLLLQLVSNQNANIIAITLLFLVVVFSAGLFVKIEPKAKDPIIPIHFFKNQLFLIQIFTALLLSAVQIGFQTYFPMWLQTVYHVAPSVAGLAVTPSPIFWLFSSFSVGYLIKRWAPKWIAIPLITILMISYLPLTLINNHAPIAIFYIISAITGTVLGIVITMNTLISQHVVDEKDVGSASSMLTLGRTLGQTFATGLFGLIFNFTISKHQFEFPKANIVKLMNQLISQNQPEESKKLIQIFLTSMHNIFIFTAFLFICLLILNIMDRQNKLIK